MIASEALQDFARGGEEHRTLRGEHVYHKATYPGRYGFTVIPVNGLPTLTHALPLEYLERLLLANQTFDDDIRLVGVTREAGGLVLVTTQPTIVGEACGAGEMIAYFEARRFSLLRGFSSGYRGSLSFYRDLDQLAVFDAHRRRPATGGRGAGRSTGSLVLGDWHGLPQTDAEASRFIPIPSAAFPHHLHSRRAAQRSPGPRKTRRHRRHAGGEIGIRSQRGECRLARCIRLAFHPPFWQLVAMADAHTSPVAKKKDFFISYTSVDLAWARWIDLQLKSAGMTTVVQCVDFLAGGDFLTEMDKAVRECHRLMPVFSPAHFRSQFCQLERNAYLALDPDGSKRLILPAVVEPCEDLGLFRSRIHIDLSTLDEAAASRALLAAVKNGGPTDLGPITFPGKPTTPAGIPSAPFPRQPLPPNNLSSAGISPNESYVPRAVQMAKLEKAITPRSTVALTQALQGDGGFGKTEIAKAYLYAHAHEFDGLWWLDASAEGHSLSTDKLATALGIDFPLDIDRAALRGEICSQLSQGRHLLVLDNLDDPALLAAWPLQPPAVRLVTTRLHCPAIARLHSVKVAELSAGEARVLLRQYRDDPTHDATFNEIATLLV